jgi:hypothetical protein
MKTKTEVKEFIEKHAEIKLLKPVSDPNIRVDPDNEETVIYNGELIRLSVDENPTLGFKFIKLKEKFDICKMGCGEVVANQIIERRLAFTPKKHWRIRCATCNKYQGPDGQSIISSSSGAQQAYIRYFKENKQEE